MSDRSRTPAAQMEGAAALPRRNGELVFEAPWQSRIFGATVAMHEAGLFEWREFQGRLIEEIARQDSEDYYRRWLTAFERLLVERGLLGRDEIERRAGEYRRLERDLLD
jgi:nitrile hydratase accessory protein